MVKAIEQELTAVDDRTFKVILKSLSKMMAALGKNNADGRRFHAGTDRPKPIRSSKISNMSAADPCARRKKMGNTRQACYEKIADIYVPRRSRSWLAGGNAIMVDRKYEMIV